MSTDASADRVERAARNQSLFRAVNERLEELAAAFHDVAQPTMFACECAAIKCAAQMEMSVDEYEALRQHPNRFAVLPGHVDPDVENVVSETERFVVVEKIGVGGTIARQTYARS